MRSRRRHRPGHAASSPAASTTESPGNLKPSGPASGVPAADRPLHRPSARICRARRCCSDNPKVSRERSRTCAALPGTGAGAGRVRNVKAALSCWPRSLAASRSWPGRLLGRTRFAHPRRLGDQFNAVPGDGRLHEADRTGVAAATDDPVARALLPVGGAASGLVAVGLPQLFESCRLAAGERLQFGVVEQRGHLLGVADRQRLQPQPGGFECHSSRPVIQAPLRAA